MPKLKNSTPQSLEDLCLSAVVNCLETDLVLCEVANRLSPSSLLLRGIDLSLTQIARELSDYMSILPGTLSEMVRQEITTRVLKKYANKLSTHSHTRDTTPFNSLPFHTMTLRLLEIILNEDVHSFDLSGLVLFARPESARPASGEPELWELVLSHCTGLRKFSLPPSLSTSFGINLNSFILSLASQCNQLTELILKDAVQDPKVLCVLGANCHSLRVLDVTGSSLTCTHVLYLIFPDLMEAGLGSNYSLKSKRNGLLPYLPTGFQQSRLCPKMREFIVSDTKIRSVGTYYALKYFPNLESLGVCYHIASGIKKHVIEGFCNFRLKHAYTRGLTKDKISLVCSACPDLETLYISSSINPQFTFKLHNLSKVRSLKILTLESSSCLDLTGLKYVSQLTTLKIQVPDVDVGQIAESCPLLQRLVITKAPSRYFTLSKERLIKHNLFIHLQELQVDCPMSVITAELIITEAKLLRIVKLVRIKKLTDRILARWLDKNPLAALETWLLTYAHLTAESVTLLLNRCPNLSTLGRLSGWDVRSWESRRLQRKWQDYDINLILFSHKQEDVAQIMDATASSDEEQE